ncbi:SNF2-related protein [Salipaludibacillus sp. HK11]|uniref:DEAD/DEAH box helicase n=1 Tax=Salipaludibacillus sp. HK11 TaxID=3394320 RepID=UPI0039FCD7A8
MVAIRFDSDSKGVILFQRNSKNITGMLGSFVPKSNLLSVKHQLFHSHSPSFYGVKFAMKLFNMAYNGEDPQSTQAIWIPLEDIHVLLEIDTTDIIGPIHQTTHNFIQLLNEANESIKAKRVFPNRNGSWEMDAELKSKVMNAQIPVATINMNNNDQLQIDTQNKQSVDKFINEWLQSYVLTPITSSNDWSLFKESIRMKSEDGQLINWIKSLENNKDRFTLSQHLYPICLQQWNGHPPEPFQLQLVIYEPLFNQENWTLEWFLKEWQSGSFVSLANIAAGTHPFRTNPIPWLQKESSRLATVGIPMSFQDDTSYIFYLSEQSFSNYLLNDTKRLEENGVSVFIPESLKKKIYPQLKANLSLYHDNNEIDFTNSWIKSHVSWKLQLNDVEIDETAFRELVEQQQQMIHIHDQWVVWDLEMASQLLSQIDLAQANQQISFFDGLRAALDDTHVGFSYDIADTSNHAHPIEWSLTENTKSLLENQTIKTRELSLIWQNSLRVYQQQGVTWLLNMRKAQLGCCLADDMGLGKTIQAIAYIDEVVTANKPSSPFLILCPSSLIHNWSNELKKFSKHLTVYLHQGIPTVRENQWRSGISNTAHVVICSYPTATRDLHLLKTIDWAGCIYDEAQQLKNIRTKQRKAMKMISAHHHVALTGTPIENHPFEMWTMMDLLNPGLLKDETWFSEQFLQAHGEKDKHKNLSNLRAIIRPFLLRRTKHSFMEELSLPEKTSINHIVSLTDEQKVLYEAIVEELMQSYEEQPIIVQRTMLFKTMTKLKQVCNHPAQIFKEVNSSLLDTGRSEKWDLTVKLLEEWLNSGKRGLIFTQYRFVGTLIQELGKQKFGLSIPFFHGGLNSNQRETMIHDFQTHRSAPIMVISLRAGGFGINMTEASEVIHYDRWWNPAVEAQATDRIHRIGQTKPVRVHTITTKGTIEDRIAHLLHEKKKLQKAVIDGRALPIWSLSKEELTELFQLK